MSTQDEDGLQNKQATPLEEIIFKHTDDNIELRLRSIIAFARSGNPREPKDTYVQLIKRVYETHEQSIKEQAEKEARKDQTFKVIQSLVKAGSISDYAAAHTLAMHNTLLDVHSTNNSLEEK